MLSMRLRTRDHKSSLTPATGDLKSIPKTYRVLSPPCLSGPCGGSVSLMQSREALGFLMGLGHPTSPCAARRVKQRHEPQVWQACS